MRRSPEEDYQEEIDRQQIDPAGDGGVSDERRKRARRPADDDVLRRRPLQPARIDEDVEVESRQSETRGENVRRPGEQKCRSVASATPNASTDFGPIRPAGIGRSRVRAITVSMSLSRYMFTAFAPPAIRYPPTSMIIASPKLGRPATYIGAIAVTSSSEMILGLVRVTRSASSDGLFAATAGAVTWAESRRSAAPR